MAINPKIKQKAEDIRSKIFGSEVRESLASGIEAISKDVEATIGRQGYVEEQFQDVLDETTGKDVISAPELIAARNGKSNLKTRLDDEHAQVTAQLAQMVTSVSEFGVTGVGTESSAIGIQNAINHVHSLGGGTVLIPNGTYYYDTDLHIKENVVIDCKKGSRLIPTGNYKLIVYKRARILNPVMPIPTDFQGAVMLFHTDYINDINNNDKSNGSKIRVENPIISKESSPTSNSTAFSFVATEGGFWGVTINDGYVRGFKKVIEMTTTGNGWINGNDFSSIMCQRFENVVNIAKGETSLGVDFNNFRNLKIQCDQVTKDVFVDNTNGNNYFDNEIWDMKTYTNARLGNVIVKRTANGLTYNKERYSDNLVAGRYYLIGRFSKATHSSDRVVLSFNSAGYYNTHMMIMGMGVVRISAYGRTTYDDEIRFYTREIDNGQVELYLSVTASLEVDVFFESFKQFYPSPMTSYKEVDSLVEITNRSTKHGHIELKEHNYIKTTDGTVILTGYYENASVEVVDDSNATGIKLHKGVDVLFPEGLFSEAPTITCTSRQVFRPISVGLTNVTKDGFTPQLYTTYNLGNANIFSYIAVGK